MASRSKHSTFTPSSNRVLEQKWNGMKYQNHKDRLRKIKPTVDSSKPKDYAHLKTKARKAQIENEKWEWIDKHNQQLLGKMEHIMQSRGRVDHINSYHSKPCLHHFARQQEAERVHRENLGLLRRLQTMKPMYRTDVWESDFKAHEARKSKISTFPAVKGTSSLKGKGVATGELRGTEQRDRYGGREDDVDVAEDNEDPFHLPPLVEDSRENKSLHRMPSELAKSIMAAKDRQRSKSPEEVIEIMN